MNMYPSSVELFPMHQASATVVVPGSKSITNRAYVISALADGNTVLQQALHSDDTDAMSSCLRQLGVRIDSSTSSATTILGAGGRFETPSSTLEVGNSGTTIRFLTPASALAPANSIVVLDGVARMRQRPISDLVEALDELGVSSITSDTGCPPVQVAGGGIRGGECSIKGSISSQYLSGLLLSSPYADTDVTIYVDGELTSKPYVDMTIAMMESFGAFVSRTGYQQFTVEAGQRYIGRVYEIEPDASNASYFLGAAAVTGGTVTIEGLGTRSIQGDVALIKVLEMMGCAITEEPYSLTVTGPQSLAPIEFDASAIPDMAQTIAVIAAFATGTSILTGLKTLRVKETDRIHALAVELRKIGSPVEEGPDYLKIHPASNLMAANVDTYEDHRMAMSFAIAGLKIPGLIINAPGCVAKTFPDFWNRWELAFPGSVSGKVLV